MPEYANRVAVNTTTTGTGTVTLGSEITNGFCTFAEGGISNGDVVSYLITEGDDFEIGVGTYTSSRTTLSRDTVETSKISGTAGTSKMNLGGTAVVRVIAKASDYAAMRSESIASFAEANSATADRLLSAANIWDDLAVLTDGATIAVDFNNGYDFGGSSNAALALGGNRTLGAPTNARNGKKGVLWFGASGSTRTLTLNGAWNLCEGAEEGPYEITTSQTLGVAYVIRGTTVYVTAILRIG